MFLEVEDLHVDVHYKWKKSFKADLSLMEV
jgi:hypothetical protein